jgi:hypothetical protein
MRGLSRVYDIFIGFVARHNKDGLLRGHQMSDARPIKILYTLRFAKIGRVFSQYLNGDPRGAIRTSCSDWPGLSERSGPRSSAT